MVTSLEKRNKIAERLLDDPYLKDYIKAGFVSQIEIRNCKIIKDYLSLRKHHKQLDALDKIAMKYSLSTERIIYILYKKS